MSTPHELISSYLDGTCAEADLQALADWANADPANARELAFWGMLHYGLADHFRALDLNCDIDSTNGDLAEAMILPAIRLPDAPSKPAPEPMWSPQTTPATRSARKIPSRPAVRSGDALRWHLIASVAVIAMFVLGGIGLSTYLAAPNDRPRYARVEAQVAPRWGAGELAPYLGETIPNRPVFLRSGLVQLRFKGGVSVVVQGPCSFQAKSSHELYLFSGQLAASVPHTQIGFSVHTPQAIVTDLGTQFGVRSGRSGIADVLVFKGKVAANSILANGRLSNHMARIVHAGSAVRASSAGIALVSASHLHLHFVRSLTSQSLKLNLVDMIAGGNGLGDRTGMGINPATGQVGNLAPQGNRPGNGAFNRITSIPIVSGCFVPGSGQGPSIVDPQGDYYDFPTSVNNVFGNIWAGGKVPWYNTPPTVSISTTLDGCNYSKYPHDVLVIHSNSGLTLNLNAVRRLYPGTHVKALEAIVGDSFVGPDNYDHIARPKANIYVLADGDPIFRKIGITGEDAPIHLMLKLPAHCHFLTLATTDGGDGTSDDWVLWCDPKIVLKTITKK